MAKHLTLPEQVIDLLRRLFECNGMPNHPLLDAYLTMLPVVPEHESARVLRGQRLFQLYGPECFLILAAYSLPLAYAAGDGVQVIYRARRLKDDPIRRLCDTAQMVLNVMQPGGLAPGALGARTLRKVRLVHALVRRHVMLTEGNSWCARYGVPINQEDLTGTLLTFSVGVLDGLQTMGVRVSTDDASAYLSVWSAVARQLGLDEALVRAAEAEPHALARQIAARHHRATPEGQELAARLAGAIDTLLPLPGYGVSLTRHFLERSQLGNDLASVLGLPAANWTRGLVRARAAQKRVVMALLERVPGAKQRRSFMARRFAQAIVLRHHPQDAFHFELPEHWLRGAPARVR